MHVRAADKSHSALFGVSSEKSAKRLACSSGRLFWCAWRDFSDAPHPPFCSSPFGRLEPLVTQQSTGLLSFTLAPFRFRVPSNRTSYSSHYASTQGNLRRCKKRVQDGSKLPLHRCRPYWATLRKVLFLILRHISCADISFVIRNP